MTRRPLWAAWLAALLVCATMLLAACGDDEESGSSADAGTTASESSDAFPVTITHKFGETTIEKEPKRVVVVGYTEQDAVLALGVKPVAVREFMGGYDYNARPWAQQFTKGEKLPTVGAEEIDFEKVAAQRPDVIIAINTGMDKSAYDTLTKIAPTVAQSDEYIDFGVPWQEQTKVIGQALGRSDEAEKVIADTEATFKKVGEEHPAIAGRNAILAYGSTAANYGAYASADYRSRFFEDLGLETPREVDKLAGKSFYVDFSSEQIRLMDQDVVIFFGAKDDAVKNPVFKRLDAVKEDRVIYLDLEDQLAGALGFGSAPSLKYAAENFAPMLAAALDDDPATKITQPE